VIHHRLSKLQRSSRRNSQVFVWHRQVAHAENFDDIVLLVILMLLSFQWFYADDWMRKRASGLLTCPVKPKVFFWETKHKALRSCKITSNKCCNGHKCCLITALLHTCMKNAARMLIMHDIMCDLRSHHQVTRDWLQHVVLWIFSFLHKHDAARNILLQHAWSCKAINVTRNIFVLTFISTDSMVIGQYWAHLLYCLLWRKHHSCCVFKLFHVWNALNLVHIHAALKSTFWVNLLIELLFSAPLVPNLVILSEQIKTSYLP